MKSKVVGRIGERGEPTARRVRPNHRLGHTLDEYEGFIRAKAWQFARRYDDQKDFQQVGREAVVKVFGAIEGGLNVRSVKGYYLTCIQNAMLDYYRKEHRRNFEVWEYDKKNGPTRVKRYRYGGEWRGRIQYHGDKLKRVALGHRAPQDLEKIFPYGV